MSERHGERETWDDARLLFFIFFFTLCRDGEPTAVERSGARCAHVYGGEQHDVVRLDRDGRSKVFLESRSTLSLYYNNGLHPRGT